jgi:hypothetical protein
MAIHRKILQRCISQWGISRRGLSIDPAVVAQVQHIFHHTTKDDAAISRELEAQGLHLTALQVKRLRLTQGWRRRTADDEQLAEQRAGTFEIVQ